MQTSLVLMFGFTQQPTTAEVYIKIIVGLLPGFVKSGFAEYSARTTEKSAGFFYF